MFTGFPSTQTPAVQWWDFTKSNASTSNSISLAADCAPIQYFATSSSSVPTINVYLPVNAVQGKTITFKNDKWGQASSNQQSITIIDDSSRFYKTVAVLGVSGSITLCYITQNTLQGYNNLGIGNWVCISNTGGQNPQNFYSVNAGGYNNSVQAGYSTVSGGNNNFAGGSTTSYSTVGGGNGNQATGGSAVVSGGSSNLASGGQSVVCGGSSNQATNTLSTVCGGQSNTATAFYSVVAGGNGSNSSGQASGIVSGEGNSAEGSHSFIGAGAYGTTRSIAGNSVFSSGRGPISSTLGITQSGLLVLAAQTTNATATVLKSNSSAAGTTNQVILPNNSAYFFRGEVIAGKTAAGDAKGWTIEGVIKRGAGVGTTALVGTPTITSLYADAGAAAWSIAVTADTTNGGLKVAVTGQAATTIQWVCEIQTTEMTY
jgi:hypothetical protein